MLAEHDEVPSGIRESLLAVVPGDEAGIEMLRTRMRKLVNHPRPGHPLMLASPQALRHLIYRPPRQPRPACPQADGPGG